MSTKSQVSGINPSKKSDEQHGEIDRISDLPDWAISHILSRLPCTKDAVRTSVLSKDWEYKWTSIHHIVVNDGMLATCENESKKATFVNFVERSLDLLQNLQSFSLCCAQKYDLIRMKTWISVALSRNVQELIIWYVTASFVLPRNLLNCYSLRILMITSPCTLKLSALICLPHLKTLRFQRLEIVNEDSVTDLLKLNFPVLESFELLLIKWVNVKFMEIYAPKMTRFSYWTPHDNASVNSIKVIGDSLVDFEYTGDFAENIDLSGSTLLSAALNNFFNRDDVRSFEKSGLRVRKLLKRFSSLRKLRLSGLVEEALSRPILGLSLPIYYMMKQLVLDSCSNFEVLLELLHAAPILKFLRVGVMGCNIDDYDVEEYYVPSCVVSHLEEVTTSLSGVRTMDELKLIKFFLKNAVTLKSMRVDCCPLKPKEMDKIKEELRTYSRASTCLIIVDTWKM